MSDRFKPIPPSELTPEQQKAYDELTEVAEQSFGNKFVYKNPDGTMIGPFAPLLYTPTLVDPFLKLNTALSKLSGFPPKARETAILATGSVYKAGYEMYAHSAVAESVDLSKRQVDAIKKGVKPEGEDKLSEQEEVAFDIAIELSKGGGPLSKNNWDRALGSFGKEGTAALIHYVSLYAYTCILLNGADASVPE